MVLLSISILFFLEQWLEIKVIALKDPGLKNYPSLNKGEHFRSAIFAGYIISLACLVEIVFFQNYWMIPAIVINRRIFFDYILIISMDWDWRRYSGTDWWNNFLKSIFGEEGRFKELIVELAITIFCIIKTYFL